MFNFIFDGRIGDILAPVVPSNQLFLAIQHHKNAEIPGLLATTNYSATSTSDGGYGAIHVACRYNNRYAVDLLLSQGTPLTVVDRNGDSPLHYAAKFNNLDMCRYLVSVGAPVHLRNKAGQSAYDVAESHFVRQYLLPLVLSSERANGIAPPEYSTYGGMTGTSGHVYQQAPVATAVPPPPPAYGQPMTYQQVPYPPPAPAPVPGSIVQPAPLPLRAPSPADAPYAPGPPAVISPPAAYQAPSPVATAIAASTGSGRIIVPDGFHSSASDPVLQQKYGHIIERPAIAPPPTSFPVATAPIGIAATPGAAPSYPTYPSMGPPPAVSAGATPMNTTVFQRYVPYDPHSNSAAPVAPPVYVAPPHQQLPSYPGIAPPAAYAPTSAHHAPAPGVYSSSISIQSDAPPTATATALPASPVAPAGGLTSRLLGNKAIPADVNVFNPATDTTVIVDAQSSSSSIL